MVTTGSNPSLCCRPAPQLSCLTALALTARLRARPTPVPDALSTLTGLQQLKLSHGLQQVGECTVGGEPGANLGETNPQLSARGMQSAIKSAARQHARRPITCTTPLLPATPLQVPPAIVGLSALTLLDLSYNALHSLRPGAYLKRLVVSGYFALLLRR